MPKILIVEDESNMLLGLRDNCESEGYEVISSQDGEDAIARCLRDRPDIVLLDVMLPKLSGIDVCRSLRRKGVDTPIIMLTARGQEVDKVVGLEVGADDYVTKPFSIRELLARIRAHLRRTSKRGAPAEEYSFGDVEINFKSYQASRNGKSLDLSPREFEILKYMAEHEGELITREALLDAVWGYANYPVTRTVDNHIAQLRKKIEDISSTPKHIVTVHRVGYKFIP